MLNIKICVWFIGIRFMMARPEKFWLGNSLPIMLSLNVHVDEHSCTRWEQRVTR